MAKTLRTTVEVIDELGGTAVVAKMFGRRYTAVHNWRQFEQFPATTYLALTQALEAKGLRADPRLWRMDQVA